VLLQVRLHCLCRATTDFSFIECRQLCCRLAHLCCADEGILHMQLLKRNRRGHYSNGTTAADTFWYSLLAAAKGGDRLPGPHPPTCYYSSAYEADDLALQ
jgi:hypothetical protein